MSAGSTRVGEVDGILGSCKPLWFSTECPLYISMRAGAVGSLRACLERGVRGNSLDLVKRSREREGENLDPSPTTATFPSGF